MDHLPKRKELVFQRVRKTLYLQLTTVIRSIASKWPVCGQGGADRVRATTEDLRSVTEQTDTLFCATEPHRLHCVLAEIRNVKFLYLRFDMSESGYAVHTRKLRAGIERLEFLRDNWDDLEIIGDLKSGYRLELRK